MFRELDDVVALEELAITSEETLITDIKKSDAFDSILSRKHERTKAERQSDEL